MRKFIYKISIFVSPLIVYSIIAMFTMPLLLSIFNGPSTKEQISISFRNAIKVNYETLIMGNSRMYRGLNPDFFSIKTYNFSHDNDSYNQIYYKLTYLLNNNKDIKNLILGVDYFQFSFISDTRNYVYADFLDKKYLEDYNRNIIKLKFEYYLGNINPKKILSLRNQSTKPFLRENGQYIKYGIAKENDSIKRDINRLKIQVKYFNKILQICEDKNIKVFMLMLPIRLNELQSYTKEETNRFNNFILEFSNNEDVFYLNYSELDLFKTNDYTDITHFNEMAANRFSIILNNDIMNLLYN